MSPDAPDGCPFHDMTADDMIGSSRGPMRADMACDVWHQRALVDRWTLEAYRAAMNIELDHLVNGTRGYAPVPPMPTGSPLDDIRAAAARVTAAGLCPDRPTSPADPPPTFTVVARDGAVTVRRDHPAGPLEDLAIRADLRVPAGVAYVGRSDDVDAMLRAYPVDTDPSPYPIAEMLADLRRAAAVHPYRPHSVVTITGIDR